jgi:hypothetical protein
MIFRYLCLPLLLICIKVQGQTLNQEPVFTPEQLQEDFLFLRKKLERNHPNLYAYNTPKTVDAMFDKMYAGIDSAMTATEFYRYISAIQPTIQDGHNYLLPSAQKQAFHAENSLYFPINFIVYNEKLYISQNLSNDTTLQIGDEICAINDENAIDIFRFMVDRQVRDGHNLSYPRWITQTYFRSYYGFLFGFKAQHKLQIKTATGTLRTLQIDALPLQTVLNRRKAVVPLRYDRMDYEKGVFWETNKDQNYTLLTIKTWSKDLMKTEYYQDFKEEINDFAQVLEESGTQNLIIDIRGNQGGEGSYGIHLLRYLLPKPFNYFYAVKKLNRYGKLKNTAPSLTATYKRRPFVFRGNIYVLTNGGSFSNSGIFAAVIQNEKRGKIVGSETGGNAVLLTGGADYYALPHTQINMLKATHQMAITDPITNTGAGVQPDIEIKPELNDILRNNDVVLKKVVALIGEKNIQVHK